MHAHLTAARDEASSFTCTVSAGKLEKSLSSSASRQATVRRPLKGPRCPGSRAAVRIPAGPAGEFHPAAPRLIGIRLWLCCADCRSPSSFLQARELSIPERWEVLPVHRGKAAQRAIEAKAVDFILQPSPGATTLASSPRAGQRWRSPSSAARLRSGRRFSLPKKVFGVKPKRSVKVGFFCALAKL